MELTIFVGLQASGKSTYYRTHFADGYEHISMDLLRNNRQPQRRQLQLIEQALVQQRSVVVDNTNATVEVRKPLIAMGRMYGANIIGYYFQTEVSHCLERNKQREGRARVPNVAIYATLKRLERPTYAEGFDKLYIVRIGTEGRFDVQMIAYEESAR